MASSPPEDETAGMEKQIDLPHLATSQISEASGQKKSFLHYVGWKVRKYPATGGVFFLDFPFYRTSQDLEQRLEKTTFSRVALPCASCIATGQTTPNAHRANATIPPTIKPTPFTFTHVSSDIEPIRGITVFIQ